MEELHLTSELSMEEIENNFKDEELFSGIVSGLEEALVFKNGMANAESNTGRS